MVGDNAQEQAIHFDDKISTYSEIIRALLEPPMAQSSSQLLSAQLQSRSAAEEDLGFDDIDE